MGKHLYDAIDKRTEIVGIAKNYYNGTNALPVLHNGTNALPILRGNSQRPLWITSTGDAEVAASRIRVMAGDNRIPMLAKKVDSLARKTAAHYI